MIAAVRNWFVALTERERLLVSIAALLAAAVVLIFGIVLPLSRAHDAAHLRHRAAIEASARLLAGLELLNSQPASSGATSGPLAQVAATSADAAGLVLQTNQPRGSDATTIAIPAARPSAALVWIDGLASRGVVVESLTMTPAADGSVSVNATMRQAAR